MRNDYCYFYINFATDTSAQIIMAIVNIAIMLQFSMHAHNDNNKLTQISLTDNNDATAMIKQLNNSKK